ncbi:DUF3618 domain-containing protein [Luteococcus sp. OSA5]|uniref:DUF3618 domain-containing protein n=1 Tax=Luteococcus sp. OSA5 TaxID=3401630 RepID=UPI003B43B948
MADKKTDTRSAQQIRADIAAARARMGANVEGLVNEVHPKAVKQRSVDEAKAFVMTEVDHAKSQVKDEDGWRTDRLSLAGAAAGAVAVSLLVVRAIVRQVGKSAEKKSLKKAAKQAAQQASEQAKQARKEASKQAKQAAKQASKQAKHARKQAAKRS